MYRCNACFLPETFRTWRREAFRTVWGRRRVRHSGCSWAFSPGHCERSETIQSGSPRRSVPRDDRAPWDSSVEIGTPAGPGQPCRSSLYGQRSRNPGQKPSRSKHLLRIIGDDRETLRATSAEPRKAQALTSLVMGFASLSQMSFETRAICAVACSPRGCDEASRHAQILPGDRVRCDRAFHQLGETTFEPVREVSSAGRVGADARQGARTLAVGRSPVGAQGWRRIKRIVVDAHHRRSLTLPSAAPAGVDRRC